MIDVSEYQGVIAWQLVRQAGHTRAYIKASEGVTGIDPRRHFNATRARACGIKVGFYHYAHPSNSPRAEAEHFLRSAGRHMRVGDLVPALDLEVSEGHDYRYLNAWKAQWLHIVDAAIGVPHGTVFYSYYYFWKEMQLFADRPVWGAAYGNFTPPPSWAVWQYSSTGRVKGIRGPVDLDRHLKALPLIRRVP